MREQDGKIFDEKEKRMVQKMKGYTWDSFCADCKDLGVVLTSDQIAQFQKYYEVLAEWNSFMNLTAITEFEEVLKKHFLDSLAIVKTVDITSVKRLIDIGTGAGFPGIPLKIAFPHLDVVLLDSLKKRVNFLNHVTEELHLTEVTALHGRAEDYAKKDDLREKFDLVVSRAVANLSTLCEYCIPYTIQNGRFVSYKSGNMEDELCSAEHAIKVLGGKLAEVCRFSLPGTGERSLLVIEKTKSTAKKYPRKAGMPSREPL